MCDIWLDVDSALAEVPVNILPLLDDTDFKSREESVAYNAAGMELIWHFTTTAGATSATVVTPTTGGAYDWAHQDGGMYTIEIPASGGASANNDTEGFGWFTGKATGVLPWRGPVIGFRAAALNNALIDGGDTLDVNVTEISGDSTAADNCELMFDGTGYAGGSTKLGVDTVAISGDSTAANNAESFFDGTGYAGTNNVIPTVTTLTGHTAQTGDAYAVVAHANYGNAKLVRSTTPANTLTVDASHQALALTNAITNDAITAASIANGAIDAATFAAGAITATVIATGAIDADAIADGAIDNGAFAADAISAAKIAADVTTELQSGLATSAELAKVPKSDSNVTWNATALASIQAEATDALNAYDPPTNAELEARTLVAASYFDPAADAVANVTTVGSVTGAVGSVTGAVGSVTGNVGGNVIGSVGSVAAGGITAASIATNAIDADALAADAVTEIQSGLATAAAVADVPTVAEFEARTLLAASYFDPAADTVAHVTLVDTTTTNTDMVTVGDVADAVWDEALAGHAVAGSAGATLSAASAPTAADVADAVWDEAIAGHLGAGTTGAALSAAGAAGDPWLTALPGAYADGTAGDIIGNLVTDIGALTPAVAISATTAASVSTGALAVRTYHSLSQAISSTYAGNLNAATKLWLAVKAEKDDTDAQAVIFIEKTAGLTVLAGAAYTTVAHGSLTVGGLAGAWTVTVALDEVATGLLTPYADGMLWAECKALVAGATVAVWDGVCDVARGIVVAVA